MWNSDQQHRFYAAAQCILRAGALALLLGLPGAEQTAWAAPAVSVAAALPADRQALRDSLAGKYEALPVHDGVVLKPRTKRWACAPSR